MSVTATRARLMPGETIQVRSAGEILATLDENGCLDNLPFMPEMLQYCGEQFRVYRRADKTCDTVNKTGGRRMHNAVHLVGNRCDGSSHGGCQAACLLFWNERWLTRKLKSEPEAAERSDPDVSAVTAYCERERDDDGEVAYRCQATELPAFTTLLHWWDVRQYVRDLRTGNTTLGRLIRIMTLAAFRGVVRIGIGARALIALYDKFQELRGGRPFPMITGTLEKTPVEKLDLQPGEYVRVKSLDEVVATLDRHNKNRGLRFDPEMARFCGGTYRVLQRMDKIIDERTGRMLQFGTSSVVLEEVFCRSEFSSCRLFCPRAIYSYWREIWLERVSPGDPP